MPLRGLHSSVLRLTPCSLLSVMFLPSSRRQITTGSGVPVARQRSRTSPFSLVVKRSAVSSKSMMSGGITTSMYPICAQSPLRKGDDLNLLLSDRSDETLCNTIRVNCISDTHVTAMQHARARSRHAYYLYSRSKWLFNSDDGRKQRIRAFVQAARYSYSWKLCE